MAEERARDLHHTLFCTQRASSARYVSNKYIVGRVSRVRAHRWNETKYKRSKGTWRREHKNKIEDSRIVLNATKHEKRNERNKEKKNNASKKYELRYFVSRFITMNALVWSATTTASAAYGKDRFGRSFVDTLGWCEFLNVAKIKMYGKVVHAVRSHYNTLSPSSLSPRLPLRLPFCKIFGWIAYKERALRLDLLEKSQRFLSAMNLRNQRGELRKTFHFMD